MNSETDSNITYCTEVEEMFIACSTSLNKSSINLPLRRSQRLSQKLIKSSETNKNIDLKFVPPSSVVPLDLSHKSKESTIETSQLAIDEAITTNNFPRADAINHKDIGRSRNLIYKNQSQRQRISSSKISRKKCLKKAPPKTLQDAKGNNCSNQVIAKDVTKTLNKYFKNESMNKNDRAKDSAILSKGECLQNNKVEEKTCFSNVGSTTTRKTNKKAFVKQSRHRFVPVQRTEFLENIKPNHIKPSTRSRKRKHKHGEIVSKSNNQSNKKENTPHNHMKVSEEINVNTTNFGADFTIKNSFQTKIERANDKKSDKRQIIYTTPNKIKSNRVLRSQNEIPRKQLCGQITTNLENEHNKIKMEKFTQKSCDEGIQTIPSVIANQVCCQYMENKFSTIEVKHENRGAKFHTKLPEETDTIQKTLTSLQKVELATENCQNEMESNKSIVTKNYLKSFDKNQFLDKIRNTQSYLHHLPLANSNLRNSGEIPPTPAESSEELLKRSILFNAYPAHFKHQLPPEAILTRSLDPQPLPTPDETFSSELLDSSSSSPSLPESLCDLFKTTDIKDILDLKRTSYHLNSYHIQALALILNLQIEYLLKILDKVVNTSPNVLKNIEKAIKTPFVADNDLFSNSSNEFWNSTNVVPNSQSPKQRTISYGIK